MQRGQFIFFLTLLVCHCSLSGQIISSLSVSNDSVRVGDEIEVYYKLTVPLSYQIESIDFSGWDSLTSLVDTNPADTSGIPRYADIDWRGRIEDQENKRLQYNLLPKSDLQTAYEYRDTFNASFWDFGIYQIGHPTLLPDSVFTEDNVMLLESPVILIYPPDGIQNPDTTSLILPITDILTTDKPWWAGLFPWIYLLVPLILLGLLLYFLVRKKPQEQVLVTVEKPKEPAHVIALKKLDTIEQEGAWKKGLVKKYQSDLTYTIREYMEGRYDIQALESTTDEISRSLASTDLDHTQISELKEILQIADLVKFAKATPTNDINEEFLTKAKNFVIDTKSITTGSHNIEDNG